MTDTATKNLIWILKWLVGLALSTAVGLGVWAYKDRVAYDEKQDTRIEGVDRDLQSYKLRVAETLPDKEDLQLLRKSIDDLRAEVEESKSQR